MSFLDSTGVTTLVTRLKSYFALKIELTSKQDALISGTNIKTVNNNSLLGSGNVSISVPTASTSTPLMDGTASYGSGTSYARSNHVHPTDTSRQATLVSGTNIKTVNGNSLLGSGDLAISGGADITTATATLTVAGWSSNMQTVNVTGVTSSNSVIVSAAPSSISDYSSAGVYCSAQGSGTLTFTCSSTPTSEITVNAMALNSKTIFLSSGAFSASRSVDVTLSNNCPLQSDITYYVEKNGTTFEMVYNLRGDKPYLVPVGKTLPTADWTLGCWESNLNILSYTNYTSTTEAVTSLVLFTK